MSTEPTELINYVVSSLVKNPDQIRVKAIPADEQQTIVELRVDESDLSRVIGKGGSVIHSLRAMLKACSEKQKAHYVLELIE